MTENNDLASLSPQTAGQKGQIEAFNTSLNNLGVTYY